MEDPFTSRWRLAAALLLALMLVNFVRVTRPVRLATNDDVSLQAAFSGRSPGGADRFLADWSEQQGRFYFSTAAYKAPYAVYRVRDPALFSLARAVLLFSQFALTGWLLARLCRSEAAGWLSALVAAGALHIPAVFYPVLSYPAYSAGSIALLLSLHCFLTGVRGSRAAWLFAAGCLQLLALLWHENFLAFTVLFPVLAWAAGADRSARGVLRASLPAAAVSAAYLAVYVTFNREYATGYDGTVFSFNLAGAGTAWLRQTLAATPGFELFVSRLAPYPSTGPLWKSAPEIAGILGSVALLGGALALAGAAVATALARRAAAGAPAAARVLLFILVAAAVPNLLPSFTQKFQENAHHRFYPYVYSFNSYCWGVCAAVCLWQGLAARLRPGGSRLRILLAALFLLLGALFVSAQASNQHTLELLRKWYN
jgi:hypothetical protein